MEEANVHGQRFFSQMNHPENHKKLKLVYKLGKHEIVKPGIAYFPPSYEEVKVGDWRLTS